MRRSSVIIVFFILFYLLIIVKSLRAAEWIKDQNGCLFHNTYSVNTESVRWNGDFKRKFNNEDFKIHGFGILEWIQDGLPVARFEGYIYWGELICGILTEPKKNDKENRSFFTGYWREGTEFIGTWTDPDGKDHLWNWDFDKNQGKIPEGTEKKVAAESTVSGKKSA